MKAIQCENRAELFVLNGNKRTIRYEFHNDAKHSQYHGNIVQDMGYFFYFYFFFEKIQEATWFKPFGLFVENFW